MFARVISSFEGIANLKVSRGWTIELVRVPTLTMLDPMGRFRASNARATKISRSAPSKRAPTALTNMLGWVIGLAGVFEDSW